MEVELVGRGYGRSRRQLGIEVWIGFAAQEIGFALADKSWSDSRQLIALGNGIFFRPRVFSKRPQHENRISGLYAVFLGEFRGSLGISGECEGEFAVLRSVAGRREQELGSSRENHERAGAIVQEQRRTHFPDLVTKIALGVRFDDQAIVKAVGMTEGRNHCVRADGFAGYLDAAQCGGADGGAGSIHNEALALKQTKTAPEEIRTKSYAQPRPK